MSLARILRDRGYAGTLTEAVRLLQAPSGFTYMGQPTCRLPAHFLTNNDVDPSAVLLDEKPLAPGPGVLVALHKPGGVVCSSVGAKGAPPVTGMLPVFLSRRVQPAGRLDKDSTGLVLLTDDGQLLHNIIDSWNLEKEYVVRTRTALRNGDISKLEAGDLRIKHMPKPPGEEMPRLLPVKVKVEGENLLSLTLQQGKHHQVRGFSNADMLMISLGLVSSAVLNTKIKDMLRALGNEALSIHRVRIGRLRLGGLLAGRWRYADRSELT
jgi:16S rRNA pseudouridine516 synthase